MSGYTKLFGLILDSTVWETSLPVKVTWITMLAMADRDGIVEASIPSLAKRAGVERSECEAALAIFLAPDPDSRTKANEGRRIEEVEGGWRLLNYDKYRRRASLEELKEKAAERQRRFRSKAEPSRDVTDVTDVTESNDIAEASPAPSPSLDQERTTRARELEPVVVNPHSQRTNLINGADLRRHGSHAWCDHDRALCVPYSLHDEFLKRSGKSDAEVRAWYPTVIASFAGQPIGDDTFAFWKNAFGAWVGTVTARPQSKPASKASASVDAGNRVAAELAAQAQRRLR